LATSSRTVGRVYEALENDIEQKTLSPTAHGEINAAIRSSRAALDKYINCLYLEANGKRAGSLTFPIHDVDRFRLRLTEAKSGLDWLSSLPPEISEGIAHVLRDGGPVRRLKELYRDAAHHANIAFVERQYEVQLLGPIFSIVDGEMMLGGAPKWLGFPKNSDVVRVDDPGLTLVTGTFSDFRFETGESILLLLSEVHNEVSVLYLDTCDAMGWRNDFHQNFLSLASY